MVRPPKNIPDHCEQLRPAIRRSTGSTPSERYLAKLAERTFLNLWSYPNPFRFQKQSGNGDGKELCDLLVVCDPHVIIFSEKDIRWTEAPLEVAWPRWYRRAVLEACKQLTGAERWIREMPDRIFLDHDCKEPFPLNFPPPERRRFHRIIVARGAAEACRSHFGGGLGTLMIFMPPGDATAENSKSLADHPFVVGDIDPSGDFVHVFDEVALDIIMRELDTITDFTSYLDKRATFLRSKNFGMATGEENLLAYYAGHMNENGEHDFTSPGGGEWSEVDVLAVDEGHFRGYVSSREYRDKVLANKVSYAWDRLIETFTQHLIDGTSIVLPGYSYSLEDSEAAVRYMALQNRSIRRGLSEAVLDALAKGKHGDKFFRAIVSPEGSLQADTGFFILTAKYKSWMDSQGGYEDYRLYRAFNLRTYALALLMRFPYLKRVVGVAMEPPSQGRGASEDVLLVEQSDWSQEERDQLHEDCNQLGIMREMKETPHRIFEYPLKSAGEPKFSGNRKERRAKAAAARSKRLNKFV